MSALTVMAVDDEPLALRRLELALAAVPGFTHVASADGLRTGLERYAEVRPDILIVDIKMRDGTGFDLLEQLGHEPLPAIVFATAFDHFAARAFETRAVDYVLKPIELPRLRAALQRARTRLAEGAAAESVAELRAVIENLRSSLTRADDERSRPEIWVRGSQGTMTRIALIDVRFVTSEDDYVRLHLTDRSYLVRMSIRQFESQVPRKDFIRVHRNALVRRSAIADVARSGSRVHAVLDDGRVVEAGRIHARGLLAMVRDARLD